MAVSPWTSIPRSTWGLAPSDKDYKFSLDCGARNATVGGDLTFQGPQVYASFLF